MRGREPRRVEDVIATRTGPGAFAPGPFVDVVALTLASGAP
jgi:hypothetical protein